MNADVIGDAMSLLEVVRDDHDRDLLAQLDDQVLYHLRRLRVERRAWLVKQQHLGIGGQRASDAEPLLLAAGEAQRGMVEVVLDLLEQTGPRQRLLDLRTQCRSRGLRFACSRST